MVVMLSSTKYEFRHVPSWDGLRTHLETNSMSVINITFPTGTVTGKFHSKIGDP